MARLGFLKLTCVDHPKSGMSKEEKIFKNIQYVVLQETFNNNISSDTRLVKQIHCILYWSSTLNTQISCNEPVYGY